MTTDRESGNDPHHAADMRMIESLLREALKPDAAAGEARIQRVLAALDRNATGTGDVTTRRSAPRARPPHRRRWAQLALAACLLLAIGLWWQSVSPTRRAYATVELSLESAESPGTREYQFAAVVRRPIVGRREIEGELYLDGANRFVVRHPVVLPGAVWIGGNEREHWIVPPVGPVLVGDERMLQNWISEQREWTTPYLHITTMLRRMSKSYELELLPNEPIPDFSAARRHVVCRRVRGALRDARDRSLPRIIDLWADAASGMARRVVLDWQLAPDQFGRSMLTLVLAGEPDLPSDWFEHTGHHQGRMVVSAER